MNELPSLYRHQSVGYVPPGALSGGLKTSVVVVGAGLTGLSAALALAERSTDVVVLDAHEPGFGASGRNGGQVNPGWKHPPGDIEGLFGGDRAEGMISFAYGAPDALFSLTKRLGIDCEARQNGTIRAATNPRNLQDLQVLAEDCAARGMPVELLSREAVAKATGTDCYPGGLLDRRGGDVNPLKLLRGLEDAAGRRGVKIFGHSPATSIEKIQGGWRVQTPSGHVIADKVLLATNGYTDGLWQGLARSIVPVFGAIAATDTLPTSLAEAIMPSRTALYESGRITVYYRVDVSNRLIIGGRGPMRPIGGVHEISHVTAYALYLWPDLARLSWTHCWNGQLAMTEDAWPHLHELAPGIWSCLGYNGRGVALSVALGPRLADLLLGMEREIELPVTDMKTIRLHAFWPLGVAWHVAIGRLKDRLGL